MKIKLNGEGYFSGDIFNKVMWIKQLRRDVGCPIDEQSEIGSCYLGIKDAKTAADILQSLVGTHNYSKYSFVVDTDDYPELTNLAKVVFEHTKNSSLFYIFDKQESVKELLKSAVIKMIEDEFYYNASRVLEVLKDIK